MTRSRASAKAAGTRFESSIAGYLAEHVDERIERRARYGAKDRGDVSGVRTFRGGRVVIEAKDYGGRYQVGDWINETDTERLNDDAVCGVVVAKRRGTAYPGDQIVMMTLADLVALLTGERPSDEGCGPPDARTATNGPQTQPRQLKSTQSLSGPLSGSLAKTKDGS